MPKYYNLLKSVHWIKKRQKILKRDGYKCTACGSEDNLQVHHTFYFTPRVKPWEYPDDSLLTVCEPCHNDWHLHHENEFKKLKPKKKKKSNKEKWDDIIKDKVHRLKIRYFKNNKS